LQTVCKDLWGYAAQENLSNEQLIKEQYQGIRPAPGYPACPGHAVKEKMFEVLGCTDIGMTITENFSMSPAASVSGFYFSHPQSQYFNVGPIGEDQVVDLQKRSGLPESLVRRAMIG
jgi:5-methyltetrahydrofolate--homocysteine methyltransferase